MAIVSSLFIRWGVTKFTYILHYIYIYIYMYVCIYIYIYANYKACFDFAVVSKLTNKKEHTFLLPPQEHIYIYIYIILTPHILISISVYIRIDWINLRIDNLHHFILFSVCLYIYIYIYIYPTHSFFFFFFLVFLMFLATDVPVFLTCQNN